MNHLIPIKKIKSLQMSYDPIAREVYIQFGKVYFTLKKNEIFPVKRGLESCVQRFWRRKIKHE